MKLSILIPSIPERLEKVARLYYKLQSQIKGRPVEILSLCDNMKMSIGEKRNKLKDMAKGEYWAFVDDDDDISDNYIDAFFANYDSAYAVVTFRQQCQIEDKNPFIVSFGLKNKNEELQYDGEGNFLNINRQPFHICFWKTDLFRDITFANVGYSEDAFYVENAVRSAKRINI